MRYTLNCEEPVVMLARLQVEMQRGSALYPQLGEPLDYRAEMHQVRGYFSISASVGLADALLLRAHAFAGVRSLLEVARDVLPGRIRLPPEEDDDD